MIDRVSDRPVTTAPITEWQHDTQRCRELVHTLMNYLEEGIEASPEDKKEDRELTDYQRAWLWGAKASATDALVKLTDLLLKISNAIAERAAPEIAEAGEEFQPPDMGIMRRYVERKGMQATD